MQRFKHSPVKRRLIGAWLVASSFIAPALLAPSGARAADGDLDNDARQVGYQGQNVVLDSGPATTYLLLGGLALLACAVTFKDARRTHKKS